MYKTKIRIYCDGRLYNEGDIVDENTAIAIGLNDCEAIDSTPTDEVDDEKPKAKKKK